MSFHLQNFQEFPVTYEDSDVFNLLHEDSNDIIPQEYLETLKPFEEVLL